MINFAAIMPHSPLLLPTVGKDNRVQAQKTLNALAELKDRFKSAGPDVLLVISPHGHIEDKMFSLHINDPFLSDLKDFGDFGTSLSWPLAAKLALSIDSAFIDEALVFSTALPKLDHGSLVPLILLDEAVKNMPILPLHYSGLDLHAHFEFGQRLGQVIADAKERVAVIASGDLAHTHSESAPAGYSPKAAKFDNRLIEAIKKKNTDFLLKLKPELSAEVKDCGLRSFILLMGIIDNREYQPEILSYEAPFGVGQAVIDCGIRL